MFHKSRLRRWLKEFKSQVLSTAFFTFRRISETDDEVLLMEMSSLLDSVSVSGQHVLLAAQKLSIQPGVALYREELISATQNVFLAVVKVSVFLSWWRETPTLS